MEAGTQPIGSAVLEPHWLSDWKARRISSIEALDRFDASEGVRSEAMIGRWRGISLATGHPLDGLLEELGWYGKAFEGLDCVHPLLFRSASGELIALNPGLMPAALALRAPRLARSQMVRLAFSTAQPLFRTRRSAAVLQMIQFRGRDSAAMVYDRQPIVDYFRRVDDARILGLMQIRNWRQPFFFLLVRDDLQLGSSRDATK